MVRARAMVLLLAAGCGRLGFGGDDATDGDLLADDTVDPGVLEPDVIQGMIAYWNFDNASVSPGSVDVAQGRAATCAAGECPTPTAGIVGMAVQFDGTNDCLHVPSITTWPTAFTISAWVRTSVGGGPFVVHDFSGGCPSPALMGSNGGVGLVMLDPNDVHQEAWTQPMLQTAWQHVAVSWNGTTQEVYVDGVCQCGVVPPLPHIYAPVETVLGCYPGNGQYYRGALDEVRIFDRTLTAGEIAALGAVDGRPAPAPQSCAATCATVAP